MNFIKELFKNKKKKEIKYLSEFTITSGDIKKHNFYKTGKAFTSPSELESCEGMIDADINNYMQESIAKILETTIDELSYTMLVVINLPFMNTDVSNILTCDLNEMDIKTRLDHPAYALLKSLIDNRGKDLSLYGFLQILASQYIEIESVHYQPNRVLELKNKTHILNGEEETANMEIMYIDNFDRIVNSNIDTSSLQQVSERTTDNNYKGIILQDFTSINEITYLDELLKVNLENSVDITNILEYIYQYLNKNISYLCYIDGILYIKGINPTNIIMTTVARDNLPECLRRLPLVENIDNSKVIKRIM